MKEAYGELYPEVEKLNNPPVSHEIDSFLIKKNWQKIRQIIKSMPSEKTIHEKMIAAGSPTEVKEIQVSEELKDLGMKFHPHMRHRISLMRLKFLFDEA